MPEAFTGDSFFTLSVLERVGLVAVSLTMLIGLGGIVCAIARRYGVLFAGLPPLVLYWGFLWIAPQIYYSYYIAIFDGLPWQWVIGAPPVPLEVFNLVTFQTRETLSEMSQGVGFWLVLVAPLVCRKLYSPN